MADDTDDRSALGSLQAREDFRGFKESMLLYALEKGDVEGIFSDDGSDATVGYQTLTTAARRREWMLLSGKLTGRVGRQIKNPTLRNVWNTAMATSVSDGKAEYRFALAMAAVEKACGGIEETAKQIARTSFKVALMSFEEQSGKSDGKSGFVHYADGVRVAEQKLAHAGVVMTDEEKKEKFYGAFNPSSASWNTIKTFWQQSATLTFDEILARGIQQQQSLHAVEAEVNAHGVRKLAATAATAEFAATEMTGFDARDTGSLASSTDHDTENKRNITTDFENVRKQIIGFKKMRDDDLITEDEFEAKKKQLLGLASSF